MQLKDLVSREVWEIIKDNYEKGSYTPAIINFIHYINEIIQEKSNLDGIDNTNLIEKAFFGKTPTLQINKFETRTEKDIQEGIGHLLKGACLAIRNPRSHERYTDNKETADKIILFYDYVLSFVKKSEQPNIVEDWIEFIFEDNFPNTKEYARLVVNELSEKKRFDLLINIFRSRERAKPNKLNNLVNLLLESIKANEYKEFMDIVNKELLSCGADDKLKMFFNIFPPEKWSEITPLTKLRIEDIIKQSILNALPEYEEVDYNNYCFYAINTEGQRAIWAVNFIDYFETVSTIKSCIHLRENCDKTLRKEYFEKYFSKYLNKNLRTQAVDFIEIGDDDELPF